MPKQMTRPTPQAEAPPAEPPFNPATASPDDHPPHKAANDNLAKLNAELAQVDQQLADAQEKARKAGPATIGAGLVVGLDYTPEAIPDTAPLLARRRELEGALRLQRQVVDREYGAASRMLSQKAAPLLREKCNDMLAAIIDAREAVLAYRQLRIQLNGRFDLMGPGPLVPIDPAIFGEVNSHLAALVGRTQEALK